MRLFPALPPVAPSPAPAARPRVGAWQVAVLLTTVIFSLLLFENQHYLFATDLYENTDHASDSLMVREAKHSFLLHGHYSQWRFYHPGPALLDTLAAGEAVFYDALGVVPTPYNGQLIMLCLVMTIFFSVALSVFARQLGSGGLLFFLPLALVFAGWHYAAVGGQVFLDAWPAYPPVLTMLCFLVVAAAAAAGDGWQLPMLVITGSWLVHNHVAQPLFVAPLTLLAYIGLLASCRQRQRAISPAIQARGLAHTLTAGWREFPRAHGIATALLALFVLPLFVDALQGRHSNLNRILEFMRTQHEPGRKFARSLCYFLTFGGYSPYVPGSRDFGRYSALGMLAFAQAHWRAYTFWIVALLGAPTLFLVAARRRQRLGTTAEEPGSARFLSWFYAMLAAAWMLTLLWGMYQHGPLYYYNAYFDYSLYFCLALGLAAALAMTLMAWTHVPGGRKARLEIAALLWVCVTGTLASQGHYFRVVKFGTPADAAMAHTVEKAAATLPKNALCFLDCRPWENWEVAIAVALEMERLGYRVRVNDNWEIIFGNPLTVQHEKIDMATPLVRWLVVSNDLTGGPNPWPLSPNRRLDIETPPAVDPNGQRITFSSGGNYHEYAYFGWSPANDEWAWSDQRTALLVFRPLPLPVDTTGVDLLISAWTVPPPGKTDLQRAVIHCNDVSLGTAYLPLVGPDVPPLRIRVSAALWHEAVERGEARVKFEFPDAKSPSSLGLGVDTRLLGGGFRSIEFQPARP